MPDYAERELRYWLRYDPAAPREHPRPAYVVSIWQRTIERVVAMMDMTKGVQTGSDSVACTQPLAKQTRGCDRR